MDLIHLLIVLAIVGFAVYLLRRFVPMPAAIQTGILWAACIGCFLYVLAFFGFNIGSLPNFRR